MWNFLFITVGMIIAFFSAVVMFIVGVIKKCFKILIKDDEWISYCRTANGFYYYDIESINWISDDIVEVWTREICSEEGKKEYISFLIETEISPEKARGFSEIRHLWKIDTKNRKRAVFSTIFYDKHGTVLYRHDFSKVDWLSVCPDSVEELLWKEMCKLKKLKKL